MDFNDGELWAGIIASIWTVFIVTAVAFIAHHLFTERTTTSGAPNPLEVARQRYARGEISREEFHRMQQDLAGHFIGYPSDFVFGVVNDSGEADNTTRDLKTAGFEEADVRVFRGDAGALHIDATGSSHGLLPELWRFLQAITTDGQDVREYETEAREGHSVIGVHSHGGARRDRAVEVLRSHNAHHINYYGRLYFQNIDP